MRSLDRKVFRDLWTMKGQALAIILVMASGGATFVMSLSTLDSLWETRESYYQESRFAHLFTSLKRAPESVRHQIESIAGVLQVETRVVASANLEIENFPDPVSARLISVPDDGNPLLNQLYLRRGRLMERRKETEVLVSEAFAEAHGFNPGDQFAAIINGRRKVLTIVGVALSPEFIYHVRPGEMIPDFESYGIVWMARSSLVAAFDLEGAFNDVVVTVSPETRPQDVIDAMDQILSKYGSLGAYERKDQMSHRYLTEEFRQLERMATIFPSIFLGVAAFLLNVVVARLITTQRDQIAILRAFGYRRSHIAAHYFKLVLLIALAGVAAATLLGSWFGQQLSELYMKYYRFPFLRYTLQLRVVVIAALVSTGATLVGTLFSVLKGARRPPAEALRLEIPAKYRESVVEKLGLKRWLSQPSRMIVRNLERRPWKALLSAVGIGFSYAILMVGNFFGDAIDHMVRVQFGLVQRADISVTFVEPVSRKALYQLKSLDGIHNGEPFRSVPIRVSYQHRSFRTSLEGLPAGGDLYRLLDSRLQPLEVAPHGVMLTGYLADILGVQAGDFINLEILEGSRPLKRIPVAGLVDQYMGVNAYIRLEELGRLMGEEGAISGVHLATDSDREQAIYRSLKTTPAVAGVTVRRRALENFYETMADQVLTFAFFSTLFASTIAFGVVYNSARITLSERSRELASLRVLGYSHGEISFIALGELAFLVVAAFPLGAAIGWGICYYMVRAFENDLFRIPLFIESSTYGFSATVVLASALISSMVVYRRLARLDLVEVLKTRE